MKRCKDEPIEGKGTDKPEAPIDRFDSDNLSVDEIICACGELKYPVEKTLLILSTRLTPFELSVIRHEIETDGTAMNQMYYSSLAKAEFTDRSILRANSHGFDKAAAEFVKAMALQQNRENINRVIASRFHIDLDDDQ